VVASRPGEDVVVLLFVKSLEAVIRRGSSLYHRPILGVLCWFPGVGMLGFGRIRDCFHRHGSTGTHGVSYEMNSRMQGRAGEGSKSCEESWAWTSLHEWVGGRGCH
jgi:hypothetical protein